MKSILQKIARFFKQEWFLVVMIIFISFIILLFEMYVSWEVHRPRSTADDSNGSPQALSL